MQAKQFKNEYPIYTMTLKKSDTSMPNVGAVIEHFQNKIMEHPVATFIGMFDHYRHTDALKDGVIDPSILDAQEIICCFGKELVNPEVLAVRPRAIGIVERQDDYVISFLKAPNPNANETMVAWVESLQDL